LVTHQYSFDVEGSVWSFGRNANGELGVGDTRDRNQCEKIQGLPPIKSIAGGWNHSLILDDVGSVWSCGYNGEGNLGLGDTRGDRNGFENIQGLPPIQSMAGGKPVFAFQFGLACIFLHAFAPRVFHHFHNVLEINVMHSRLYFMLRTS
jgi:hypothetical protein